MAAEPTNWDKDRLFQWCIGNEGALNDKIATYLAVLDNDEALEYGYDAIITYWVKIFITPKTGKKRVLEKAKGDN